MKSKSSFSVLSILLLLWSGSLMAQPEVLWSQTYGGIEDDRPSTVLATPDGGCLMIGRSRSFDPANYQGWAVKVDRDGAIEWTKDWGDLGDQYFIIGTLNEDGYLLLGYWNGVQTVQLGWDGELIEQRRLNPGRDVGTDYYKLGRDGRIIAASEHGDQSLSATVYNNRGEVLWSKLFQLNGLQEVRSFAPTNDGGLIWAGKIDLIQPEQLDGFLMKISSDGEVQWIHTYGGQGKDRFLYVVQLENGHYIAKGTGQVVGDEPADQWTIVTDENGELLDQFWRVKWLAYASSIVIHNEVIPTWGSSLVRYDEQWNTVWDAQTPGSTVLDAALTDEGGYWVLYYPSSQHGDFGLTKLDRDALNFFPFWKAFPDTNMLEDEDLVFDRDFLLAHVVSVDYPVDSLLISIDGAKNCILDWDGDILLLIPPENWFGTDQVRLTAKDPQGRSGSVELRFTVKPVNDPPEPFILRAPADSVDINNPLVVFAWNEAIQNQYETDSISYVLHLGVNDQIKILPHTAERMLILDDLRTLLDDMGFDNGEPVGMIEWWVTAYDSEDSTECSRRFHLNADQILSVPQSFRGVPLGFAITSAYPNPFNPSTTISYSLDHSGSVHLDLLDISGRVIVRLVDGEKSVGSHSITWDAGTAPAGVCLIRLTDGSGRMEVKKVVLIR